MSAGRDEADGEQLGRDALRHARERLGRIDARREAYRLHLGGAPVAEIASVLDVTEQRAHRMVAYVAEFGDAVTPEEVIVRAAVDGADRDALVKTLSQMDYTFTEFPPGLLVDGPKPGTWTSVCVAVSYGLLSEEEFERVATSVQPPPP